LPELPEVEARRRCLAANALGRKIDRVSVPDKRILDKATPAALSRGLKGASFTDVERRAKYLLVRTDRNSILLIHFGLTGALFFRERGERKPRFSKAEFYFEGGSCLHYTDPRLFGKIALYETTDDDDIPEIAKLGPEPLSRAFTFKRFNDVIRGHKTTLHQVLMVQELIAGIGNEYSDEIAYQAGVRPDRMTTSLSDGEVRRLYDKMKWVLKQAVNLNAELDGWADRLIIPNRGKDGECPRTHDKLSKKTIAGRTSYFCPTCQK